jgi:ABC-type sugar transport system ATPase subunit
MKTTGLEAHPTSKLETGGISKSYRGRRVVDDVTVFVQQGEVVGLLGPNGAGKTTSFYMIVGLITPDSGRILLNEQDITDLPMYQRARRGISYLPQEASVFDSGDAAHSRPGTPRKHGTPARSTGTGAGAAQPGLHAFGR